MSSKKIFLDKVRLKLTKRLVSLSEAEKQDFEARKKGLLEIEKLIEDYRKSQGSSLKLRSLEERMKLFCGLGD